MKKDVLQKVLRDYKYVLWILLIGVVLLCIPSVGKSSENKQDTASVYSLVETRQQMEQLLSKVSGAGRVSVMLTLKSSSQLTLAQDTQDDQQETDLRQERTTLKLNRGSGMQEVVVTREIYPEYLGAVVVCDGAGDSAVRLEIIRTVSVLTGLGSDKISVVQWQS